MISDLNLFDYSTPEKDETFDTLLSHKNIKIIRIVSSDQVEEKVYCQAEDEWVIILEGEATLVVNDEKRHLIKGDSLFIPAQTSHRVLTTKSGTLWLAVHIG